MLVLGRVLTNMKSSLATAATLDFFENNRKRSLEAKRNAQVRWWIICSNPKNDRTFDIVNPTSLTLEELEI